MPRSAVPVAARLRRAWQSLAGGAVCLSLRDRTERRADTMRELHRAHFPTDALLRFWLEDQPHPTDSNLGIFLGHQRAIYHALQSFPHAETLLIFEDDLLLMDNLEGMATALEEAVLWQRQQATGRRWILRLGALPILVGFPVFGFDHVVLGTYAVNMHAYLLPRRAAEHILRARFVRHLPIDVVVNFWFPGANYMLRPIVCSQRDEPSDNVKVFWAPPVLAAREIITHHVSMEWGYMWCFSGLAPALLLGTLMVVYVICRLAGVHGYPT